MSSVHLGTCSRPMSYIHIQIQVNPAQGGRRKLPKEQNIYNIRCAEETDSNLIVGNVLRGDCDACSLACFDPYSGNMYSAMFLSARRWARLLITAFDPSQEWILFCDLPTFLIFFSTFPLIFITFLYMSLLFITFLYLFLLFITSLCISLLFLTSLYSLHVSIFFFTFLHSCLLFLTFLYMALGDVPAHAFGSQTWQNTIELRFQIHSGNAHLSLYLWALEDRATTERPPADHMSTAAPGRAYTTSQPTQDCVKKPGFQRFLSFSLPTLT